MRPRDVAAHADFARQRVVAVRARDQDAEAGIGEAGAAVLHHRMHHVAVAALDQDVGHRFAERVALGDGVEMLLALAVGGGDEGVFAEPFRPGQHRARDFDVVVGGEELDDVRRRIGDRRQALGELGARLGLDLDHQPRHDIVEHADLVLGKARRAVDEQIGDAGQDLDAARTRAGGQRGFEFVKQGESSVHALRCHAIELPLRMPRER